MALLLLIAPSSGHVRLNYIDGSDLPIRNANSATGNGRASVAGACGGQNTWGANGNAAGQDGQEMTLNIQYAAGHTGAFEMSYSCDATTQDGMAAAAAKLTAGDHGCTCTMDGAPAAYPCPGATAGVECVITCTLPTQNLAVGDTSQCTVALLDQRDWGGCVDLEMASAQAILPPAPPPAPVVPSNGVYSMTKDTLVDTSAATFTCCALEAELTVPRYPENAGSIDAKLSGKSTSCRTSIEITAPTSNDMTFEEVPVTLAAAAPGSGKYKGEVLLGTPAQPFEFIVENQVLSVTNVGDDQPIICDSFSALEGAQIGGQVDSLGNNADATNDSGVVVGAVIAVFVVLVLLAVCYWFMCKRKPDAGAKGAMAPMPPPPPSMPPGWTSAVDPSSGRPYYINSATGASQWEPPAPM